MTDDTRQRIIEAGAELIHRQGFNNTGLKDILKAADVPKGSFYYFFDSKEAFGIEVVEHYGQHFKAMFKELMNDGSKSPLEQLRALFASFQEFFKSEGYSRGCPVGNLAQEMGDLSAPFRAKLNKAMEGMTTAFALILNRAQKAGEIPADIDVRDTATFIVEAWHGAIIRMKVAKSPEPLELCHKFIFNKILK